MGKRMLWDGITVVLNRFVEDAPDICKAITAVLGIMAAVPVWQAQTPATEKAVVSMAILGLFCPAVYLACMVLIQVPRLVCFLILVLAGMGSGASYRGCGSREGHGPSFKEAYQDDAHSPEGSRYQEALRYFGLDEGYSGQELKARYRRRMKTVHPDNGGSAGETAKANAYYEELRKRVAEP